MSCSFDITVIGRVGAATNIEVVAKDSSDVSFRSLACHSGWCRRMPYLNFKLRSAHVLQPARQFTSHKLPSLSGCFISPNLIEAELDAVLTSDYMSGEMDFNARKNNFSVSMVGPSCDRRGVCHSHISSVCVAARGMHILFFLLHTPFTGILTRNDA